jgi:hypothetical protein
MLKESDIREQIINYQHGDLDFRRFENWLIEQSYDGLAHKAPEVQQLVADVNFLIFEFLDREFNEDSLKARLLQLVSNVQELEIRFIYPGEIVLPNDFSIAEPKPLPAVNSENQNAFVKAAVAAFA